MDEIVNPDQAVMLSQVVWWWITPVLALLGALIGSLVSPWIDARVAERRVDRALVREARIALERWYATRVGPDVQGYPGLSDEIVTEVRNKANREFFERHFDETQKAKSALGAIRHLDHRFAEILDADTWRIPDERVGDLRAGLKDAERRAWRGKWDNKAREVADV